MSIVAAELKLFHSEVTDHTLGTNGGRVDLGAAIADATSNNIFPEVPEAERTAGSTVHKKVHFQNTNTESPILSLTSTEVFLTQETSGGDHVVAFLGTATDDQSTASGVTTVYGCAILNDITGSVVTVQVEDATMPEIFHDGDTVRLSDKTTINGAGTEEYLTIDTGGVAARAGALQALTMTSAPVGSYTPGPTVKVSSCLTPASGLVATIDNDVKTSTSGTYTIANVDVFNKAAIEEEWTVLFSSATAFTVTGTNYPALTGSGNTSTDFSLSHPDTGTNIFTIKSTTWGGTWANTETLVFQTHPAIAPVWLRRIIPAGTAAAAGNNFKLGIAGETA